MRQSLLLSIILSTLTHGQINFGSRNPVPTISSDNETDVRSGLLANDLNKHPLTGENLTTTSTTPISITAGTPPNPAKPSPLTDSRFCCCASSRTCPQGGSRVPNTPLDIDPRKGGTGVDADETDIRIVNLGEIQQVSEEERLRASGTCPAGTAECCYASQLEVTELRDQCPPLTFPNNWRQLCSENVPRSNQKQCGKRNFTPLPNLKVGDASPDEFPWTCMILTGSNDFISGCAIIPDNTENDISRGTIRVITVAHRLQKIQPSDVVKVRVQEYDASQFDKSTEKSNFQEYTVIRMMMHPKFDPKLLTNDIALLVLDKPINLLQSDGVNAACLPNCGNMFDYKFENGTGSRCWVAGWGRIDYEANQSFIQRKADVPLFDRTECEVILRDKLRSSTSPRAKKFKLDAGEICAGGETGKDACEGDGGAPLVCQSESGLWHVVGLVTWGVNCALQGVPGVYVDVFYYLNFIMQDL